MNAPKSVSLQLIPLDEALARLEVSVDPCRTCQDEIEETGIANHGEGHVSVRRVVHCQDGSFGADWDEAWVIAFLRTADRIIETPHGSFAAATGHRIAARGIDRSGPDPHAVRWHAFSAREGRP